MSHAQQQATFARLYHATLAPLRRYLSRMLRDRHEAQDVAHDAFARVYRALDGDAVRRPEALLFTTARRLALNHLQRRERGPLSPCDGDKIIPFAPAESPDVGRQVMARQEWEQVQRAITSLPAGCRQVLLLCKMEDLTHAQIAQRLGITVSTVEKQHARALRLLRAALAGESSGQSGTKEAFGSAAE